MEKSKKSIHSVPTSRYSSRGRSRGSLNLTPEKDVRKGKSFSLLPAMIKTFGPSFFLGAALKIMCDR